MVARLLLAVAGALMSSACLIAPDDTVLPDLPPKRNSPLRVLAASVVPAQRKSTIYVGLPSPTCRPTEFSLTVADDDVVDAIRSQWFVDPDVAYVPSTTNPAFSGGVIFGASAVNRLVKAPNAMLTFLSSLKDGREHLIEAWVTDSDFDADAPPTKVSRPPRTLPDGTQVADFGYTASNVWVITVEDCP